MGPPGKKEVNEVEEVREVEDAMAAQCGSRRRNVKRGLARAYGVTEKNASGAQELTQRDRSTEFTETAASNAVFPLSFFAFLCVSVQVFLSLRGCEEFPIIAGAR
jgi:hypothetical protein